MYDERAEPPSTDLHHVVRDKAGATAGAAPPQNLDAEERVLGAMLANEKTLPRVVESGLAEDDFYLNSNARLYAVMCDMHALGEPVDTTLVITELERRDELDGIGGAIRVNELFAMTTATANAPDHAQLIREAAVRRNVAKEALHLHQLAMARPAELHELGERTELLYSQLKRGAGRSREIDCHVEVLDTQRLLATAPPAPAWTWDGYLERGTVGLLHGRGGVSKSLFAMSLAASVVTGRSFLGVPTQKLRVLLLDAENPQSTLHARLHQLGFVSDNADGLTILRASAPILATDSVEDYLTATISAYDAGLVILDSQRGLWGLDENEQGIVRPFFSMLRRVAERTGAAVLMIHHDNKQGGYSGSTDLDASVDTRLQLTEVSPAGADSPRTLCLEHRKARASERRRDIDYTLTAAGGSGFADVRITLQRLYEESSGAPLNDKQRRAVEFVRDGGPARTKDIAEHVGVTTKSVQRWRRRLEQNGIDSDGDGEWWPRQADTDTTDMRRVAAESPCPPPKEPDTDEPDMAAQSGTQPNNHGASEDGHAGLLYEENIADDRTHVAATRASDASLDCSSPESDAAELAEPF